MKRAQLIAVAAWILLFTQAAMAAPARDIAVSPGDLVIDIAIKAEVGTYRFNTKMQVAMKNDKTAIMSVNSDDPKNPVKCKLTIHPVLQPAGSMVALHLAVEVRAGNDTLTRSLDLTTPVGLEGQMKDQRETPHEKLELNWIVTIR